MTITFVRKLKKQIFKHANSFDWLALGMVSWTTDVCQWGQVIDTE